QPRPPAPDPTDPSARPAPGVGARRLRKIVDRAFALLAVGVAALAPPFAAVSEISAAPFGVPAPLLYVLIVWALLIGAAAALSRALQRADDDARSGR
ncbi:MAG: hypothetical protein AAFR16_01050, partial [Pseudomonadota bacterium]